MAPILPLDEMTVAEKLQAIEVLWDDLCRTPESLPTPDWHGEVLAAREQLLRDGKTKFLDFEEVRERLRKACNEDRNPP
jgi:putative addiction module component (TIGR02574 family)